MALDPLSFKTLKAGPITVQGFSRSALATYVMVPEFDMMFDIGNCPLEAVPFNNIFLSHTHGDHSNDLLRHSRLRALRDLSPATYWMSFRHEAAFHKLTESTAIFQGARTYSCPPTKLLSDRETVATVNKKHITSFPVAHRGHSLGFTISETRTKLKPEYLSLTGREIAIRRANGETLTENTVFPMFTYIGDCVGDSLFAEDHIWASEVLCLECTYLLNDDLELAKVNKHTHLSEIKAALNKYYSGQHIVLKHFSLRHSVSEIKQILAPLIKEYPTIQLLV